MSGYWHGFFVGGAVGLAIGAFVTYASMLAWVVPFMQRLTVEIHGAIGRPSVSRPLSRSGAIRSGLGVGTPLADEPARENAHT